MSTAHISEAPGRIARAAAGLAVLSGLSVLLGWTFGIVPLKSVFPGLPEMAPLSPLRILVVGVALRSKRGREELRPGLRSVVGDEG